MITQNESAPLHQVVGQLRELLSNGTPGPWKYADHVGDGTTIALIGNTFVVGPPCMAVIDEVPDCALIVAAVNALPALLAIAEAASTAAHHWQRACQAEPGAGRIADNAMVELQSALSLLPNPSDQRAEGSAASRC